MGCDKNRRLRPRGVSLSKAKKKVPLFSLSLSRRKRRLRVSGKFAVKFYSSPEESIIETYLIFLPSSFSIPRYGFLRLPLKIELESRNPFQSISGSDSLQREYNGGS
ncbi:hypothetical protein Bca4012_016341 [Brassica carinata]